MVCEVQVYEPPVLTDPVLIEGLPGIGFVANIAALHLVQELKENSLQNIKNKGENLKYSPNLSIQEDNQMKTQTQKKKPLLRIMSGFSYTRTSQTIL